MIKVCQWCHVVICEIPDGPEISGCPRVSHGICTSCREEHSHDWDDPTEPEKGKNNAQG